MKLFCLFVLFFSFHIPSERTVQIMTEQGLIRVEHRVRMLAAVVVVVLAAGGGAGGGGEGRRWKSSGRWQDAGAGDVSVRLEARGRGTVFLASVPSCCVHPSRRLPGYFLRGF